MHVYMYSTSKFYMGLILSNYVQFHKFPHNLPFIQFQTAIVISEYRQWLYLAHIKNGTINTVIWGLNRVKMCRGNCTVLCNGKVCYFELRLLPNNSY